MVSVPGRGEWTGGADSESQCIPEPGRAGNCARRIGARARRGDRMIAEGDKSYVLFPLGEKRFALRAETVTELARPDSVQTFPHRTPLLTGVLVRRGRIVPVCDVAQVLVGPAAPPRKFYLIANCKIGARQELTAVPVTGECELASAASVALTGTEPPYVSGILSLGDETIAVVALEKLICAEATA